MRVLPRSDAARRRHAIWRSVPTVRFGDCGVGMAHGLRPRPKTRANPRQFARGLQAMTPGAARIARRPDRSSEVTPASMSMRRRLDPDAPAVENIARVIGAGATARLISAFGGGRVYIAKHPSAAVALARVIGSEAAGRLGELF